MSGPVRMAMTVVATAATFLAVATTSAAASSAALEYKGRLLIEAPTGWAGAETGPGHNFGKFRLQLSWTATANTESGTYWHFQSLHGTVHLDHNGGPEPEPECTATLSARPGGEDFVSVSPAEGHPSKVEVTTSLPLRYGMLRSSQEEGNCSAEAALFGSEYAGFNEFYDHETDKGEVEEMELATKPKLIAPPGGPWSGSFDALWTHEEPAGAGSPYLIEIASKLTVGTPESGGGSSDGNGTSPGGPGKGVEYGPWFDKAKHDAEVDLRNHAIPNAEHYCLPYAGGLAMAGAGVLTLGLGPAGGMLAMTGTMTSAALAPFCNATITRLVKDYKTFKDPPLGSIEVLAKPHPVSAVGKLPGCGSYETSVRKVCGELRAAYANLDSAAAGIAANATAIEETVSREHAALARRDKAAIKKQDAHLGKLLTQQAAAEKQQTKRGKAVAAVLSSAQIGFQVPESQAAKVATHAAKKLAGTGVTVRALRKVESSAFVPAEADLLAGLRGL
ncbi:MAG TPA: hypothetical protein VHA76_07870 [Solirubrobacterales bacterium]|nr:hypothetical protein [Solirubrobacterales bacterium]